MEINRSDLSDFIRDMDPDQFASYMQSESIQGLVAMCAGCSTMRRVNNLKNEILLQIKERSIEDGAFTEWQSERDQDMRKQIFSR